MPGYVVVAAGSNHSIQIYIHNIFELLFYLSTKNKLYKPNMYILCKTKI